MGMSTAEKSARYRAKLVERVCIECGKSFMESRTRKGICDPCKSIRRSKFRPQTFRACEHCGETFGPVDRLAQRFCSKKCKFEAAKTGRRTVRKTITKARSAQSLLTYHVNAGHIVRPTECEECGKTGCRIEGAHYDYSEPLRVRWLCRSCHVKWDKAEPKNATVILTRWEQATGKTAELIEHGTPKIDG